MAPSPATDVETFSADEPIERLSAGELQFERYRKLAGFVLAPLVFLAVWFTDFPSLKPDAHHLAAIMATVITLWMTESIPMPVTSLLGACACVITGVGSAKSVFAPFSDPLMFLFIGSFILARAIFIHGLDRRLAFTVLSLPAIGARPSRILFAFGAVTAILSAWMSNTATTAMMFAIGMSILTFLVSGGGGVKIDRRYATGLMLMTSFAASIGGIATPVGTPPNLIGKGYIEAATGEKITFFEWMSVGVPIVCVLFMFLYFYLNWLCPAGTRELAGSRALLEDQRRKLGPLTTAERSTLIAFLVTVSLWVLPGVVAIVTGSESQEFKTLTRYLPETVVALIGAILLFVLPGQRGERAMTWNEANKIDWGVVLIYGGGFALSVLSQETGLADVMAESLKSLFHLRDDWTLLFAATLTAALTSELTSNTASAQLIIPAVITYCKAIDADPFGPALGATLGSSLGFMLPVSTPCNAIVYGSGYIPIGRMIRYGLLLDVAGVVVVTGMLSLMLPWIRG